MAIKHMDGFDFKFADNTPGIWDFVYRDGGFGAEGNISYESGAIARTGSGYICFSGDYVWGETSAVRKLLSGMVGVTEVFFGMALYFPTWFIHHDVSLPFFSYCGTDEATKICFCINKDNGRIEVRQGSATGTLLGTSDNFIGTGAWFYVEGRIVLDGAAGIVQVKINNSLSLDLSGLDTMPVGDFISSIVVGTKGGSAESYNFKVDDFVFLDTSGTVGNTWPRMMGVYPTFPVADGAYTQWTAVGAPTVYEATNEIATLGTPSDDEVTMATSSLIGDVSTVQLTPILPDGEVHGVMIVSRVANSQSAANEMRHVVLADATLYRQDPFTPTTSFANKIEFIHINPSTSLPWTRDELNAAEFGWERVS